MAEQLILNELQEENQLTIEYDEAFGNQKRLEDFEDEFSLQNMEVEGEFDGDESAYVKDGPEFAQEYESSEDVYAEMDGGSDY